MTHWARISQFGRCTLSQSNYTYNIDDGRKKMILNNLTFFLIIQIICVRWLWILQLAFSFQKLVKLVRSILLHKFSLVYIIQHIIISGKCAYFSMYSGGNIDERNCTSSSRLVCPEKRYTDQKTPRTVSNASHFR